MTLFPLSLPFRAWLEVDGYTLPYCARYKDIEISDSSLQLKFAASGGELEAVSFGRKFTVKALEATTVLELQPTGRTGQLVDRYGNTGYTLAAQDPATTTAKANGLLADRSSALVFVAPGQATGKQQLAILDGGKVELSDDLSRHERIIVQCPVLYPAVAQMSNDPLDTLTVHLVGRASDHTYAYVRIPECRLPEGRLPKQGQPVRLISLLFDRDRIETRPLTIPS
jgi:hypothetical protein